MKHIQYSCLLLLLLLTACGTNNDSTPNNISEPTASQSAEVKFEFPKTFYKKLKGTIGDGIAITMDLIKDESVLSGNYYYDKVGLPLSIEGVLSTNQETMLIELNEKYEETGSFTGKFSSENVFEGTWSNPKKTKSLPFKLTTTTAGVAGIAFEEHREENCDNRDRNLKDPKSEEDMWLTDTMCSYIDLRLLKVTTENVAATKAINGTVENEIIGGEREYASIEAYLRSINDVAEDEYLSLEQYCGVVTNDRNILCVSIGAFEFSGGAHPNSWTSYLNFDIRTGAVLRLEDLLIPGGKPKLDAIGARLFLGGDDADSESMDWEFEGGSFKLNDNFAITTGGLLFTFNPYEIGPYAAGSPQVFIPYKEMAGLIKKSGPLEQFQKH